MARKRTIGLNPDKGFVWIFDGGNAGVKFKIGSYENEFPHMIAPITKHEYEVAMSRDNGASDVGLMQIGSQYYAVGKIAESFEVTRRQGRAKYTPDYYGVLFAQAVAQAYRKTPDHLSGVGIEIEVYASHATGDFAYSDEVATSLAGAWSFTAGGTKFNFKVAKSRISTFEEPIGGYFNASIRIERDAVLFDLIGREVGIFDIGGGTSGVAAVSGDGTVQINTATSVPQGINTALDRFEQGILRTHNERFRNSQRIPVARLRNALKTRVYEGFGLPKGLDVKADADRALAPLLNELTSLWSSRLNGGASLDTVVFTGGGAAILGERLEKHLQHNDIRYADDLSSIQFANVRGAAKLMAIGE